MTKYDPTLLKAIKDANAADGKRSSAYTALTKVAATQGQEQFGAQCDALFSAIKTNEDGLGKRLGCKTGKKPGTFKVPSSCSAARSYLDAAFELGIPVNDEAGSARMFGHIRDEVIAAKKDLKRAANVDPSLAAFADELRALASYLENLNLDMTPDHRKFIVHGKRAIAEWQSAFDSIGVEDDAKTLEATIKAAIERETKAWKGRKAA